MINRRDFFKGLAATAAALSLPFQQALPTAAASVSGWHHCAVTRSGDVVKMFVDGELVEGGTSGNLVGLRVDDKEHLLNEIRRWANGDYTASFWIKNTRADGALLDELRVEV